MKIILLGGTGQLGKTLGPFLSEIGECYTFNRSTLDLNDSDKLKNTIERICPNIIVNAAAYTDVDRAEVNKQGSYLMNALVPEWIAQIAHRINALFIHYSTDYVFDGYQKRPYSESDKTSPLNYYGYSKREGESRIRKTQSKHIILRVSWLFSEYDNNFLSTILNLAYTKNKLSIIDDQYGTPTSTHLISKITQYIIHSKRDMNGIYHLTGKGKASWAEYASYILEEASRHNMLNGDDAKSIIPIPSRDYPQKALRPTSTHLNTDKLEKQLSITLPDWRELATQVVKKLSIRVHHETNTLTTS